MLSKLSLWRLSLKRATRSRSRSSLLAFNHVKKVPSPEGAQLPRSATTASLLLVGGMVSLALSLTLQQQEQKKTVACDQQTTNVNFRVQDLYEFQDTLGEGAFGTVYQVVRKQDSPKGILLALKVIHRDSSSEDLDFEREIKALEILSHPGHVHVCRLYDQHQDDEFFYLSMEMIGGGELFEHLIQHGPFSERDASKFIRQFAKALCYIHSKGLVHMDLKPENIMMDSWDEDKAQVKVVDFGCTVQSHDDDDDDGEYKYKYKDETRGDLLLLTRGVGTVGYLPPEMLQKQRKYPLPPPSQAVDMFAAGVILYVTLTGTHPFDPTAEATDDEIAESIRRSTTAGYLDKHVFDERVRNLSPGAISLMRMLIHPDPKERLTSKEFLRHPWLQGAAASVQIIKGSDERLQRFWQRRFKAAIIKKHTTGDRTTKDPSFMSEANLRRIFQSMDIDGNGELSLNELRTSLQELLGNRNMQDIFQSLDADHNGSIDFDEFRSIMEFTFDEDSSVSASQDQALANLRGKMMDKFVMNKDARNLTKQELRRIFDLMDLDANGSLQISEIIQVLSGSFGMADEEIAIWADSVDSDMNGDVDFEEFCQSMQNKEVLNIET